MSKVYYKRVEYKDYQILGDAALELFEKVVEDNSFMLEKVIPIKVHFGEKGNKTFVPQDCYLPIINKLEELKVESKYIETNVLYRGQRTTTDNHLKVALDHGFNRLPIEIADGNLGDEFDEIVIDKTYFKSCKIGKGFSKYNQFIVMSHFKGHGMAGFGGAMKQLAMGFASRGGKLAQHSGIKPVVNESKCTSCGMCFEKCDYNAIDIVEKAIINNDKCVGCAGCIAVCPVGAIRNDWEGEHFKKKVAEYALGAQIDKKNIYISFLINITPDCDCNGQHMSYIAKDIGVFASLDPVAIDSACLDILQKESGKKLFDEGRETIEHAVEIGLGSDKYEILQLD
jgi:uncharacterized Fe-S center protein